MMQSSMPSKNGKVELSEELLAAERANKLVVQEGIPFREAYRRIAALLQRRRNS